MNTCRVFFFLQLCVWAVIAVQSSSAQSLSYYRDIAPIIKDNCLDCHMAGGSGPFALGSHEDVKKRSPQIRAVITSKFMPPCLPDAASLPILGQHRLTPVQISDIQKWVDLGCAPGDPKDTPATKPARKPRPKREPDTVPANPHAASPETQPETEPDKESEVQSSSTAPDADGWRLGKPDLVLALAEPFVVPAEGIDVTRTFVFPVRMREDRFLRAIDIRVNDARAVHHAALAIDSTGSAKMLDDSEPGPGYPAMGDIGLNLAGCAGGWTPGRPVLNLPPTIARHLPRQCDIVVEMHFSPTGKPESITPTVALYFNGGNVDHVLCCLALGSNAIEIAAGDKQYTVTDSIHIPVDMDLRSVMPHARYVCQQMRITLIGPGKKKRTLLSIGDWDFNFMQEFIFKSPVRLARGTKLVMEYVYDNSDANPQNPNHPPKPVHRGTTPSDEMAQLILQVVPVDSSDIDAVAAAHSEKQRERMKNTPPRPASIQPTKKP